MGLNNGYVTPPFLTVKTEGKKDRGKVCFRQADFACVDAAQQKR
jgi:hypothetical protein